MKKNIIKMMKVYFLIFYMGIGIYTTYITVYFKSVGLSSSQIGLIQGIGPIVSMIGLSIGGAISDRTGKMNLVLSASFLLSAICDTIFPISKMFLALLFVNTLYTFASSPILQLADAFAADNCRKEDYPFSKVKICGTVGYASIVLFSGYILKENVSYMFVIQGLVFFASALFGLFIPDRRKIEEPSKNSYGEVLKHKNLLLLYGANLLIFIPVSYYNSFFPIFISDLSNGRLEMVSLSNFLALMSEFPFLLSAFVLCKKAGSEKLLTISCILMAIRWALTAFAPNPYVLMIINMLKGASDIVFVYCTTDLLNRILEDRLKGTGQAIVGILTYGVARVIGNGLGGILTDAFGARSVFLICSVFPLIALVFIIKLNSSTYRTENKGYLYCESRPKE